jgi:hypothetical protein
MLERGLDPNPRVKEQPQPTADLRTSAASPKSSKISYTEYPLEFVQINADSLRISDQPGRVTGLGAIPYILQIGAMVVSQGQYITFQVAEMAILRILFSEILALTGSCPVEWCKSVGRLTVSGGLSRIIQAAAGGSLIRASWLTDAMVSRVM